MVKIRSWTLMSVSPRIFRATFQTLARAVAKKLFR
jgi:hypothetical protein